MDSKLKMEALISRLKEIGYTEAEVSQLIAGDFLIRALSELRRGRNGQASFRLEVNYLLSLKQMVVAADLDWVDERLLSFPFNPQLVFRGEQGAELFCFDREISTIEVLTEMEKQKCRPAILPEFLAFVSIYRKIQKDFPVVIFGSKIEIEGQAQVPILLWDAYSRAISLTALDRVWSTHVRFLACKL